MGNAKNAYSFTTSSASSWSFSHKYDHQFYEEIDEMAGKDDNMPWDIVTDFIWPTEFRMAEMFRRALVVCQTSKFEVYGDCKTELLNDRPVGFTYAYKE